MDEYTYVCQIHILIGLPTNIVNNEFVELVVTDNMRLLTVTRYWN